MALWYEPRKRASLGPVVKIMKIASVLAIVTSPMTVTILPFVVTFISLCDL